MLQHPISETRQQFDRLSVAIIESPHEEPKEWLVELSTCITLSKGWSEHSRTHQSQICARYCYALYGLRRALDQSGSGIRLPEMFRQMAMTIPPGMPLNLGIQCSERAWSNIEALKATYPANRMLN